LWSPVVSTKIENLTHRLAVEYLDGLKFHPEGFTGGGTNKKKNCKSELAVTVLFNYSTVEYHNTSFM
jgi:hypothetical protein